MPESTYELAVPFFTDDYEAQDQFMFACGFEYATVVHHIRHKRGDLLVPIHRENVDRIRRACKQFGRRCEINPIARDLDPEQIRSTLIIHPKR